jgi:hypothetical protein
MSSVVLMGKLITIVAMARYAADSATTGAMSDLRGSSL